MAKAALTVEDAKAYLDTVKTTFGAQPEVYDNFLATKRLCRILNYNLFYLHQCSTYVAYHMLPHVASNP